MMMNRNPYGERARKHWQQWLPQRFSELTDPDRFFAELGQQISQRVADLSPALEGKAPPEEAWMDKVRRLNMARFLAEGQALRELALLEPEPGLED